MRRRLVNVMTVFSLLLCVAVMAAAVRSYRTTDDLWLIHHGDAAARLNLSRGRITVGSIRPDRREPLGRIERVSRRVTRTDSLAPDRSEWPVEWRSWGGLVQYQSRPAPPGLALQVANAAQKELDTYTADVSAGRVTPDLELGYDPRLVDLEIRAERTWRAAKAVDYSFEWRLSCPALLIAPLAAAPSLLTLALLCRRRWRARAGLCPKCGYNLTGNVSGVCPECGNSV